MMKFPNSNSQKIILCHFLHLKNMTIVLLFYGVRNNNIKMLNYQGLEWEYHFFSAYFTKALTIVLRKR